MGELHFTTASPCNHRSLQGSPLCTPPPLYIALTSNSRRHSTSFPPECEILRAMCWVATGEARAVCSTDGTRGRLRYEERGSYTARSSHRAPFSGQPQVLVKIFINASDCRRPCRTRGIVSCGISHGKRASTRGDKYQAVRISTTYDHVFCLHSFLHIHQTG